MSRQTQIIRSKRSGLAPVWNAPTKQVFDQKVQMQRAYRADAEQENMAADSNPEPLGRAEDYYEAVGEAAGSMSPTDSAGSVEVADREPNVEGGANPGGHEVYQGVPQGGKHEVFALQRTVAAPTELGSEMVCVGCTELELRPPRRINSNDLTFAYKQGDKLTAEDLGGLAKVGKTVALLNGTSSQGSPGDVTGQRRTDLCSFGCPYPKLSAELTEAVQAGDVIEDTWKTHEVPKHPSGDEAAVGEEKQAREQDKNRGRGETQFKISPKDGGGKELYRHAQKDHNGKPSMCVAWLFVGQGRRTLVVKLYTISCRTQPRTDGPSSADGKWCNDDGELRPFEEEYAELMERSPHLFLI
jgi:hypothetical protein